MTRLHHVQEKGFVFGVSTERSKTTLVLRRSDGVVELEPVSSNVEMGCVDPRTLRKRRRSWM